MKATVWFLCLAACTSNAQSAIPLTSSPRAQTVIAAPSDRTQLALAPRAGTAPAPATTSAPSAAPFQPVEKVTLERQGCAGTCPVYSLDIRADDVARYLGGRFAPRRGKFKGTILFARFARWIESQDIGSFSERYGTQWMDTERLRLTVTSGRRVKRIEVGNPWQMPPKLYGIVLSIEGLQADIRWHRSR
ncbi:MAG: hypothetical protein NVS9B12_11560 [Vulcanimicrobiaceae bacterium]